MENTLILLQKLLDITAGIPLSVIPYAQKSLAKFLQNKISYTPTDTDQIWLQILRTKKLFQPELSEDVQLLIIPFREQNTLLILGPIASTAQASPSLHTIGELIFQYMSSHHGTEEPVFQHTPIPGEDITQMRRVEQRYEYSAALTNAVQQGNLSLAMHLVGQYDPSSQTTIRNSNPLRNAQNYCIVLNTQLRHALEKSGIHPFQVDRLSNEIGLEIEQLKSLSQLPTFFGGVIRRYCRLVQEHAYPHLKPLTNLAVTYIKEHLADNLTVKDTAKALTINANYLSSLFHKDMEMTFIDFVNKERTNQAAALLHHTNLQIQQIASTVGYNNTSYFAKQFLRFQGVSPSQYRRTT